MRTLKLIIKPGVAVGDTFISKESRGSRRIEVTRIGSYQIEGIVVEILRESTFNGLGMNWSVHLDKEGMTLGDKVMI